MVKIKSVSLRLVLISSSIESDCDLPILEPIKEVEFSLSVDGDDDDKSTTVVVDDGPDEEDEEDDDVSINPSIKVEFDSDEISATGKSVTIWSFALEVTLIIPESISSSLGNLIADGLSDSFVSFLILLSLGINISKLDRPSLDSFLAGKFIDEIVVKSVGTIVVSITVNEPLILTGSGINVKLFTPLSSTFVIGTVIKQ